VREADARLHAFNVRAMLADLRARDLAGDWPVVRRAPRRHLVLQRIAGERLGW